MAISTYINHTFSITHSLEWTRELSILAIFMEMGQRQCVKLEYFGKYILFLALKFPIPSCKADLFHIKYIISTKKKRRRFDEIPLYKSPTYHLKGWTSGWVVLCCSCEVHKVAQIKNISLTNNWCEGDIVFGGSGLDTQSKLLQVCKWAF